ncbi:MAG: hypothetical protein ABI415_07785 [Flavitalea sp.]
MSSAFVKENEEQWLHEIPPTLTALVNYLTKENNGISVYEKGQSVSKDSKTVHRMSNGLSYSTDKDGKWMVV